MLYPLHYIVINFNKKSLGVVEDETTRKYIMHNLKEYIKAIISKAVSSIKLKKYYLFQKQILNFFGVNKFLYITKNQNYISKKYGMI